MILQQRPRLRLSLGHGIGTSMSRGSSMYNFSSLPAEGESISNMEHIASKPLAAYILDIITELGAMRAYPPGFVALNGSRALLELG